MKAIIESIKLHPVLLFAGFITLIAVVGLSILLFLSSSQSNTLLPQTTTQNLPPTDAPLPTEPVVFTGVDTEANDQYLEEHPELLIEAKLKAQLPKSFEGFTIDYDYGDDLFVVKLMKPIGDSEKKFDSWKMTMKLTDQSRFRIE